MKHKLTDVLDYILETEERDYIENDSPKGHVYELAQRFYPLAENAPEMLEELKHIADQIFRTGQLGHTLTGLDAVIAKAEGK